MSREGDRHAPSDFAFKEPKAAAHQDAIRRLQCFFDQVPGQHRAVADIDSLPPGAASRTGIQIGRLRVAAPPTTEDTVRAVLLPSRIASPAAAPNGSEIQARPLRGVWATLFRVFVAVGRELRNHFRHRRRFMHNRHGAAHSRRAKCAACRKPPLGSRNARVSMDRRPATTLVEARSWSCISFAVRHTSTCATGEPEPSFDPVVDAFALQVHDRAPFDPSDHHPGLRVVELRAIFVGATL